MVTHISLIKYILNLVTIIILSTSSQLNYVIIIIGRRKSCEKENYKHIYANYNVIRNNRMR